MRLKGSNELTINAATMMEAVEFWLNEKIMAQPVKVTGVKEESQADGFQIKMTEPPTEKKLNMVDGD